MPPPQSRGSNVVDLMAALKSRWRKEQGEGHASEKKRDQGRAQKGPGAQARLTRSSGPVRWHIPDSDSQALGPKRRRAGSRTQRK
jgi:hypothetical protein